MAIIITIKNVYLNSLIEYIIYKLKNINLKKFIKIIIK